MGYALHGHELSPEITPNQARTGWAVGWKKPAFWGREALLAEKEAGPARLLWGLRAVGRGIPRPGMSVLDGAGHRVGEVTSGTFSPTLRTGIALALLDTAAGVVDGGSSPSTSGAGRRRCRSSGRRSFPHTCAESALRGRVAVALLRLR